MSKLVLIALADRANDNGMCWPAIETLAKDCECSRRTVERCLQKLQAGGFIERINRYADGIQQSNQYRITLGASDCRSGASESRRGGVTESHNTPIETPIVNKHSSEPSVYVEFAQAMWTRIQPITKSNRPPNFNQWAKAIRLLVEKDGRDLADVRSVFEWANQHDFWSTNILSAQTLRKQFDKLYPKWRQSYENPRQPDGTRQDTRRLSPAERIRAARREAGQRHARPT